VEGHLWTGSQQQSGEKRVYVEGNHLESSTSEAMGATQRIHA
jgi:hypothetical protein